RRGLPAQNVGEPSRLAGGEPGPGRFARWRRGTDTQADALGRAVAPAEDEMTDPDLPPARGPQAGVRAGAVGARAPDMHGEPPSCTVPHAYGGTRNSRRNRPGIPWAVTPMRGRRGPA